MIRNLPAYLLFVLALIISVDGYGQDRQVSGTVTEASSGEPLPGVNIVVQGTSRGTVTDINGQYTLGLQPGDETIIYSFVGYKSVTEQISGRTTIDVAMEQDISQLEEVVIIGYGTVQKSDLTGAVASVDGEELTKIPSANPIQALQGKVAGVQVTSTTGAPGDNPIVRIRGQGTFNDASPIYVVDGVIVDDISFLNSSDIKSMEVLKDASATAIYGNRGANGVFLITTKSGRTEVGMEVNALVEFSFQRLQNEIDLLNGREFAEVVNVIDPGTFNNIDAVPNTDWQDLLFEDNISDVLIQNHQVSISGATENSQYYASFGYFKQDGIIPKSDFERFSIRLNNSVDLTDNVNFGTNMTFAPFSRQNTNGNAPFVVYRAQPVIEPFDSEGNYNEVNGVGNVLADIEYTNSFNKGIRFVGSTYLQATIMEHFVFKTSFGADLEYSKSESFTPVFFVSPQQQNPRSRLNKGTSDRTQILWENTLTYSREFGVNRLEVLAGYTMQDNTNEFYNLTGLDIIRSGRDFWYIDATDRETLEASNNVSDAFNYSMISFLGRVNYVYDNRYLFTATFRRDGSSKFIGDNRWGNFPSVAFGWNVINEDFMTEVNWLSNLKLRASWGIIGNEKIPYREIYSVVDNNENAVFGIDETQYFGQTFGGLGNPDLTWENTYQTDIGLEIGLYEDQLTAEIDYYRKRTEDILIPLDVPGYLGNSGADVRFNAAEVLNKGVELTLNWRSDVSETFNYFVTLTGTTIDNETLSVSGSGGPNEIITANFNGNTVTRTVPGIPIGSFYGFQVDGIFQNEQELNSYPSRSDAGVGDLRFVDTNNDGVINGDDRVNLGSPIPTYLFGISLGANWRGFDVSIDFQGQGGNQIYNLKETVRPGLYNFEQHVYDYWRPERPSNTEPRPTQGGYNFLPSSRFIQDGDFFRLRNITIGYSLPETLLDRLFINRVRVYARGTNVFTITDFTGYSPEVASESAIFNNIDRGTYPVTSVYSLGLDIRF